MKTDWRRYIFGKFLPSARFAGRTWCIEPASINCEAYAHFWVTAMTPFPSDLGAEALVPCPPPEASDAHLEISAPGLTAAPDYRLNFPDTPIGLSSSPITITLTNAGMTSLRVNSIELLGGNRDYVIDPMGGGCQPTESELGRGVGHELMGHASCNSQVHFRPQFRSGIGECDRDDTVSMFCNRIAPVQITSETTNYGITLLPLTLNLNGRAIGGRLVVEPAAHEICFTTVPTPRMCTEERAITIRNEGERSVTGNITITSAYAVPSDFLATPSLVGTTLAPGEFRTVRVQYCERGDRNAGGYRINSSAPSNPTVDVAIVNPNNRTCP